MRPNVIFLDIDGVLVTRKALLKLGPKQKEPGTHTLELD